MRPLFVHRTFNINPEADYPEVAGSRHMYEFIQFLSLGDKESIYTRERTYTETVDSEYELVRIPDPRSNYKDSNLTVIEIEKDSYENISGNLDRRLVITHTKVVLRGAPYERTDFSIFNPRSGVHERFRSTLTIGFNSTDSAKFYIVPDTMLREITFDPSHSLQGLWLEVQEKLDNDIRFESIKGKKPYVMSFDEISAETPLEDMATADYREEPTPEPMEEEAEETPRKPLRRR